MSHINVNGWKFRNGEHSKGNIRVRKEGSKATAFLSGKRISVVKVNTPGEFLEWMEKIEKFATLIEDKEAEASSWEKA